VFDMLRILFSDNRQPAVWLVEDVFRIGQDADNNLVIDEPGVSTLHAEIRAENGYHYASDCDSEAGTFVNGERIGKHYQLRSDDRLRVGEVELLLIDPVKSKLRLEAAPRWSLQVIKGQDAGKKFHVSGSMTFGRSVKCELCFADMELSRRHCEFFLKNDVLEIKDLASANGVYVNDKKVDTAILQAGDQLRMGSVTLLVIGPKVEVQQDQDEDATLFVRRLDLPRPVRSRSEAPPASANPLHAAQMARAFQENNATQQSDKALDGKSPVAKGLLLVCGLTLAVVLGMSVQTLL
jgi:pSer/pThr/pTyr-binding forkhead associated (FHA) protein